ncbi:hypothetical protein [Jiangella alkaliphila]|uniref:Uncharacterized protein n=1 Tax=Jiangella alkaliphila TaxID=419479 RepID=A0A1H2LAX1_9ACTN|nr:hypothetical protein [Jiangella alkaliphila]SDU77731.1 hypothetical protein SAMN04488563_5616 [Jiangella alkaliphila]
MSDRHALAPLRRWLIDSVTPAKLTVVLIVAVLMIATSVALLSSQTDGGDSGLIEFETPATS